MIHSIILISLFVAHSFNSVDGSTNFTLTNLCNQTVWPVMFTQVGSQTLSVPVLQKGEAKTITAPTSWQGRIWGRTFCSQNSTSGNFTCLTGDCGSGKLECDGYSTTPVMLVEFSLDGPNGMDFFDISLVDGYNVPLQITPRGGSGQNCTSTGCSMDLNAQCPTELMVFGPDNELVACQGACAAFQQPQFCCVGSYASPSACKPTIYSEHFKNACPGAASYPFDDKSTFTCSSADYTLTFCPASIASLTPSPRAPSSSVGPKAPPESAGRKGNSTVTIVAIVVPVTVSLSLFGLCCFFVRRRQRKTYNFVQGDDAINDITTLESLQIDRCTIQAATRNFSVDNKLGQGGFGEVYKGTLHNGQEIAVKKLSVSSRQGAKEFKNEVVLLAKLQHRNLVRLLGFCLDREEKMLIYEFMPNKSLDFSLFDPEMQGQLDWPRRYKILEG